MWGSHLPYYPVRLPYCVASDQQEAALGFCLPIREMKLNSLILRTFLLVTLEVLTLYPLGRRYHLSPLPPSPLPAPHSAACPLQGTCRDWVKDSFALWLA